MLLVKRIRAYLTAVSSTNRCSYLGDAVLAAPGFSWLCILFVLVVWLVLSPLPRCCAAIGVKTGVDRSVAAATTVLLKARFLSSAPPPARQSFAVYMKE